MTISSSECTKESLFNSYSDHLSRLFVIRPSACHISPKTTTNCTKETSEKKSKHQYSCNGCGISRRGWDFPPTDITVEETVARVRGFGTGFSRPSKNRLQLIDSYILLLRRDLYSLLTWLQLVSNLVRCNLLPAEFSLFSKYYCCR